MTRSIDRLQHVDSRALSQHVRSLTDHVVFEVIADVREEIEMARRLVCFHYQYGSLGSFSARFDLSLESLSLKSAV